MRWLLVAATLFGGTGCLGIDTPDGSLRCADTDMYPGRACPQGFHCAGDLRCYRGDPSPADMSRTGCAALLNCELLGSSQAWNDSCLATATDKAVTLWNPIYACALNYCSGGTRTSCDTSSSCWMCVANISQPSLGSTGPCWTQISTCLANGNP